MIKLFSWLSVILVDLKSPCNFNVREKGEGCKRRLNTHHTTYSKVTVYLLLRSEFEIRKNVSVSVREFFKPKERVSLYMYFSPVRRRVKRAGV